jgi:hypothetical protein
VPEVTTGRPTVPEVTTGRPTPEVVFPPNVPPPMRRGVTSDEPLRGGSSFRPLPIVPFRPMQDDRQEQAGGESTASWLWLLLIPPAAGLALLLIVLLLVRRSAPPRTQSQWMARPESPRAW